MIPSAEQVIRRRWLLGTWFRVGGVFLIIAAVPSLASWLAEGMRDGDLFDLEYYAGRMLVSAMGLIGGPIFLAFAGAIAWLAVPVQRGPLRCPGCNYELVGLQTPQCPECGLPLSQNLIDASKVAVGEHRRRVKRFPLGMLIRPMLLFALAWFSILGIMGLLIFIVDPREGWALSLIVMATAALGFTAAATGLIQHDLATAAHRLVPPIVPAPLPSATTTQPAPQAGPAN